MDDSILGDTTTAPDLDDIPNVAGAIRSKFTDAEHGRYQHEQRWLSGYKNFRGIYDSTTQFRETEKVVCLSKLPKLKF